MAVNDITVSISPVLPPSTEDVSDKEGINATRMPKPSDEKLPRSNDSPQVGTDGKALATSICCKCGWDSTSPQRDNALENRITALEEQIKSLVSTKPTTTKDQTEEKEAVPKTISKFIPEVRWCNFRQYKNRVDPNEGVYAIEVLKAGQQLNETIKQEMDRRYAAQEQAKSPGVPWASYGVKDIMDERASWIRRIRIQSHFVLRTLAEVMNKQEIYPLDTETPTTYHEPFAPLIHFHGEVKAEFDKVVDMFKAEELASDDKGYQEEPLKEHPTASSSIGLEEPKALTTDNGSPTLKNKECTSDSKMDSNTQKDQANSVSSKCTVSRSDFEEFECYIKFVDEHLIPRFKQFRSDPVDPDCPKSIRYQDLYYLFRPGELIYRRKQPLDTSRIESTIQRVWRVYNVTTTKAEWKTDTIEKQHEKSRGRQDLSKSSTNTDDEEFTATGVMIDCYMLDYNGSTFSPVCETFEISFYPEEVEITSLAVQPLRFLPNRESIIQDLYKERQHFPRYVQSRKSLPYNGWSVISDACGDSISDANGDPMRHPQYIDSQVIIDFEEAIQTNPLWRPAFCFYIQIQNIGVQWTTDRFAILNYSDPQCTKIVSKSHEVCEDGFSAGLLEAREAIQKDRYLKVGSYNSVGEWPKHDTIPEEDIILLPTRIFAYSLRDRKFCVLNIRFIGPSQTVKEPFNNLKIDVQHKKVIHSLVSRHFATKAITAKDGSSELLGQDIIRGKGRGIVILLQGAPGVGKTATAEAVSQHYQKPLFAITCADLGDKTWEVEQNMKDIFRLAHIWDCILLLDEAEIFLTQRRTDDLTRNALVSVLLRVLEYYDGILFLTTNRPGTLDEAVKSRVHYTLHYDNINKEQALEIFDFNLKRLHEREKQRSEITGEPSLVIVDEEIMNFAQHHYTHFKPWARWNGRQIRNSFQVASSLAYCETVLSNSRSTEAPREPQLRGTHFQTVAEATYQYDSYRASIQGKLDGEMARARGDRDDAWVTTYKPPDLFGAVDSSEAFNEREHIRQGYGDAFCPPHIGYNRTMPRHDPRFNHPGGPYNTQTRLQGARYGEASDRPYSQLQEGHFVRQDNLYEPGNTSSPGGFNYVTPPTANEF